MVEKNIYLFIGEDSVSKDRKIAAIKKEIFGTDSQAFDYEVFYSDALNPQSLKEALNSLPVISQKKLIIIKQADKLSNQLKGLLFFFAKKPVKSALLILDTNKSEIKDTFIQEISGFARVFNFAKAAPLNVFDLARTIAHKRTKEALLCLSRLLKNGEKQSNIVGVIAWQWRKLRSQMAEQDFIRGLELLQEADFNIKRSRLKNDLALELLVVKLCASAS